jgi:conjugative relaxase-like TrwC/TraI family protein
VLSIGKLAAGQARYYLDQAEARVDVVESVGNGAEEYYLGGSEARGEWLGVGARELGLAGPVGAFELRRLLGGLDPRDGSRLRSSRARVAGFDLTFSAPKSVSVIFGIGDADARGAVRAAHDHAVREAVGYLERSAAAVRRGRGGAVVEQASGLVAAGFRHRTSRAGDPQLHTHVLVANLGRGSDGRWTALDGRRLYAEARTASFLYQAVLRSELTRTLGVEWTPVRKGIAEVVGVPRSVLKAFSRRRADIEAALAERSASGARAAEVAALATRRRKDTHVRADNLVGEWRASAEALGFGREELALIMGRARSRVPNAVVWERAEGQLCAATGLTERSTTFSRREVIQGLCEVLPAGARVDVAALELAAQRFLGSPEVVPLMPVGEARDEGAVFRRRDGRVMPLSMAELCYSTRELLSLEARLMDRVAGARRAGGGTTAEGMVERALAARPTLSAGQREAVERLCLDGDGGAVVVGKAGAGKTFALAAAREAWQASGYPVLGVATARRAAAELRDGAGIQSTSVAALLGELRRDAGGGLPERCVLVVDEAGMVPTRDIAALLEHVERAGGKLVMVGDHRQLPELQAGGAFGGLVQRGLAIELRENLRQRHAWERAALDHVREGRPEPALALYAGHGRLHVEATEPDARERLVRDWWAVRDPDRAVMIARRRVDVAELNALARERMRAAGALDGRELLLPGGEFAVDDRVVVKRNDLGRGVHNGDRGRVVAIDPAAITLTLAFGDRHVRLDRDFLLGVAADGEPTVLHGYAITGHVAQGLTVDHAFVLAADGMSREWAYVALSRGRESNQLYLAELSYDVREEFAPANPDPRDPIERLAASLRGSEAQVLAIDSGSPAAAAAAALRREEAERGLDEAMRARQALESRGRILLPRRRRELDDARAREREARKDLAEGRRVEAELRHGARPFVGEAELQARADRLRERIADRATERALQHDRGIERGR